MKKQVILISFLVLLLFPLLSAMQVDMNSNFSQGETLLAKISGNFLEPLQKENIFFYKGHVKIPLNYDLAKINDDYYLYAQLGAKEPNNYSLRIENIRYMQGTNIADEVIQKNFTITNNTADFRISPGFVITDKAFSIEIKNLQDFSIKIDINKNQTQETINFFKSLFSTQETYQESIQLSSGETKYLKFDPGNQTSFNFIKLSTANTSYQIPVYVFVYKHIPFIESESQEQNQLIQESSNQENKTLESKGQVQANKVKTVSTKTCAEENGTICTEKEQCNGTIEYASDDICCIGFCETVKKDNTGKILGWSMIVLIVLAILWFFFKKYKPASKEVNLLKIAKGKH